MSDATETPLTVEALLRILKQSPTKVLAGYNGSCEVAISHKELVKALKDLIPSPPPSLTGVIMSDIDPTNLPFGPAKYGLDSHLKRQKDGRIFRVVMQSMFSLDMKNVYYGVRKWSTDLQRVVGPTFIVEKEELEDPNKYAVSPSDYGSLYGPDYSWTG